MNYFNSRTKSYPAAYHAPGQSREFPQWEKLVSELSGVPAVLSSELSILTWNTTDKESILEQSLAKWGCTATVKGKGCKGWSNVDKIAYTIEFLEACETPYAMGLDAFDVILTQHPNEILRRYLKMGAPELMYNASIRSWPKGHRAMAACDTHERKQPGPFRHLNAGCWIGQRDFALAFYRLCLERAQKPLSAGLEGYEQPIVKHCAFPGMADKVTIDSNCAIFQHMSGASMLMELAAPSPTGPSQYVDLGANDGRTCYNWLLSNPGAYVFAFEPQAACMWSEYWPKIKREFPGQSAVRQAAAGTAHEFVGLVIDPAKPGGQSATTCEAKFWAQDTERVSVECIDFPKWLSENTDKETPLTVKMDIEGAEYELLETLLCHPAMGNINHLMIEWHSSKMRNRPEILYIEEETARVCEKLEISLTVFDH